MMHYILDKNKKVKKEKDLITWAMWLESADKHIAHTKLKTIYVSTIFLGLNHRFGPGKPLLFETMVFSNRTSKTKLDKKTFKFHKSLDNYTERYSTTNQALKGHKRICKLIKKTYE